MEQERRENLARLRRSRESAAKGSGESFTKSSRSHRDVTTVAPVVSSSRKQRVLSTAEPPAFRWWRYFDSASRKVYYYEEISGVTTWQEPSQPWFDAVDVPSAVSWSEPVLLSADADTCDPHDWLNTLQSNLLTLSRDIVAPDVGFR
jgi:hypothetical protein